MNKTTEQITQQIHSRFINTITREKPDCKPDDYYRWYCLRNAKEQNALCDEIAQSMKIKPKVVQQYITGEFAQNYLYKLTEEDKLLVLEIVKQSIQQPFNKIVDNILTEFLKMEKDLHHESVRKLAHYYMKQMQKFAEKTADKK